MQIVPTQQESSCSFRHRRSYATRGAPRRGRMLHGRKTVVPVVNGRSKRKTQTNLFSRQTSVPRSSTSAPGDGPESSAEAGMLKAENRDQFIFTTSAILRAKLIDTKSPSWQQRKAAAGRKEGRELGFRLAPFQSGVRIVDLKRSFVRSFKHATTSHFVRIWSARKYICSATK